MLKKLRSHYGEYNGQSKLVNDILRFPNKCFVLSMRLRQFLTVNYWLLNFPQTLHTTRMLILPASFRLYHSKLTESMPYREK